MNDKPILYEDKIKDRDNEFLYNKCVKQYHQLMNCQHKIKEYKNKINNLQSKIDKANEIIKDWHQEYNGLMETNNIYIPKDKSSLFDLRDVLKENK